MTSPLFFGTIVFVALGAVCRAFSMDKLRPLVPNDFPWTTLIVNIVSCFLMGLVLSHHLMPELQTVLATGFLAGFSTISTLNYDAIVLFQNGQYLRCLVYLVGTFALCLLACALGFIVP